MRRRAVGAVGGTVVYPLARRHGGVPKTDVPWRREEVVVANELWFQLWPVQVEQNAAALGVGPMLSEAVMEELRSLPAPVPFPPGVDPDVSHSSPGSRRN